MTLMDPMDATLNIGINARIDSIIFYKNVKEHAILDMLEKSPYKRERFNFALLFI